MQQPITLQEMKLALTRAKNSTLPCFDCIPVEVLRNSTTMEFLLHLYNKCFDTSLVPDVWQKGIITPIPKNSTNNQRVPLNYQRIPLASSVYKIYCSILNQRLNQWAEANGLVEDGQNGFLEESQLPGPSIIFGNCY